MFKFIVGFIVGYMLVICGQLRLEGQYIREGVARLKDRYYKITPISEVSNDYKVEIITGIGIQAVEDLVNDFIKDKDIIDIKYSSLFGVSDKHHSFVSDRVMVIYRDKED